MLIYIKMKGLEDVSEFPFLSLYLYIDNLIIYKDSRA